jgi:cell division protease FtsH
MIATMMEGYWGMGSTIASHGVTHQAGVGGGGRPGAPGEDEKKLLAGTLGHRIEEKLNELYARAETIVVENRREILAVAHALEAYKTLTGEDVEAIIDGRRGPLVDGSMYAHDSFIEVAEAYHESTLEAHTAHGKVAVPLPVPGSWLPVEAVVGAWTNGDGAAAGGDGSTDSDPE